MPVAPSKPGAAVAEPPAPGRVRPLLGTSARLLVSRFSYGVTPALARQVVAKGGARAWFEWQLSPDQVPDPDLVGLDQWWPGLAYSGIATWQRHTSDVEPGWVLTANYQRWLLQRRMRTRRQVHEVMTEFWEHHLHVPANGGPAFEGATGMGGLLVHDRGEVAVDQG